MFYEGSLQEGISTAVGQQKLVFCFVSNDNDESRIWENEFLQDPSLIDVIAKQAIALRLIAGSGEAGYLAQIFPLPQTPTVVIMKHGELKEYIAAGTSKEDFLRRVQASFNIQLPPPPPSAAGQPPSPDTLSSSPPTAPTSTLTGVPSSVEQSDNVRRVLEERAAKQQAAKQAAEQKAQEELAKQKARMEADTGKSKQKQAELLRKKKQQESDERRRILKRIQDDKEERRKQAQEREQQKIETQSTSDSLSPTATASQSRGSSSTKYGDFTSIQVRLFDGSTIRSRFKTASVVRDIRKWVDENRTDGQSPYEMKQLLTPLPNRPIDETEDSKSLSEVGLSPSSTLILVPIRSYASAYSDSSQGFFSRFINFLLGFFTWLLGTVGFGGGANNNRQDEAPEQNASSTSTQAKNRRVQGFENPNDRRRDHQLYNGNSLNFEPRPDEDEKK
ncbi:hypothetical protein QQS21_011561 [Conoideocrella luteorostrata]|uniref:UBX domain-containing protein 2 n=1 Tax=Conoideocrella luteorostrata TaxID=1105319 RepID=A0AAJ0CFN9_9HYPO|nr:hypothetical protein QQS21_011561 [Conoideocrella luteorostrata]